ncbi:hypothetical protein DFH28DRAFT_927615 [Melampsora americana]|nr:hypothetical protein DFH28DRAFT_927615 [Melampsora americana]
MSYSPCRQQGPPQTEGFCTTKGGSIPPELQDFILRQLNDLKSQVQAKDQDISDLRQQLKGMKMQSNAAKVQSAQDNAAALSFIASNKIKTLKNAKGQHKAGCGTLHLKAIHIMFIHASLTKIALNVKTVCIYWEMIENDSPNIVYEIKAPVLTQNSQKNLVTDTMLFVLDFWGLLEAFYPESTQRAICNAFSGSQKLTGVQKSGKISVDRKCPL